MDTYTFATSAQVDLPISLKMVKPEPDIRPFHYCTTMG
ncbi:conserved hypothetical protein [Histoplasma mississippiense (nom. inval.)]|nr:conserved hypothetical protein [Histoplasma mississippiense (nom. inval.)]EDN02841.1 conserved hypothetical protein [Histoplasma mississippiense (nom. inval.)]